MWLSFLVPAHRWYCHIYLGPVHRHNDDSHTETQPIEKILTLLTGLMAMYQVFVSYFWKDHKVLGNLCIFYNALGGTETDCHYRTQHTANS